MFYEEIIGVESWKISNDIPKLDFSSAKSALEKYVDDKKKFNDILDEQQKYLKRFGFESLLGGKSKKGSKKQSKQSRKKGSKKQSKQSSKKGSKNKIRRL